jgi:catechol 2,3-dioxygenase-like lactoylglutathione lyase family enzyme
MASQVSETIYYVHDLDQAVEFYRDALGYQLLDQQDWGWALLSIDGTNNVGLLTEAVWKQSGADYEGLPRPRIAIRTDDIEGEVARLKRRGVEVDELKEGKDAMRAVTFRDCCGNEFFLWDDGKRLEEK